MTTVRLHQFIGANREELVRRCEAKVATRSIAPAPTADIDDGVPIFLEQLIIELRRGPSQTDAIAVAAGQHGRDLLRQGLSVAQVVHDYGDVCQSVTELAIEMDAPIATDEFRTLNRCVDDAIAGAVTEHARGEAVTRNVQADELRRLTDTAIWAFTALEAGTVGISGSTATLLRTSLMGIQRMLARDVAPHDSTGGVSSTTA
jgi:hypothetical protein